MKDCITDKYFLHDYSQSAEEKEIDISEDMVQFRVTNIDPSDINIDFEQEIKQTNNKKKKSDSNQESTTTSIPLLPMPMEIVRFYNWLRNYEEGKPLKELQSIVHEIKIQEKDDLPDDVIYELKEDEN